MEQRPSIDQIAGEAVAVTPAFVLLFAIRPTVQFSGFRAQYSGIAPLPAGQEQSYLTQFSDFEGRVLGETFLEAHRIKRWPLGRIALSGKPEIAPAYADVNSPRSHLRCRTMGSAASGTRSNV